MRTSLIIFGVIFIVIGTLLYFLPTQQVSADTTTVGNGNVDARTSTASVNVPVAWAYASAVIGVILLILGLAIPSTIIRRDSKKDTFEKVVESKENIEIGDGNKRKIVRERVERHKAVADEAAD